MLNMEYLIGLDVVSFEGRKVVTRRYDRYYENGKYFMKKEEFIAHGANVTCLALGHKSGHVLVTGGDDKKVNLWAVGKPSCIISLSGHMTPIQCVRFGHTENTVCAGSVAGALKVWDLEACRLMRTLTGHKSSVRCVEFHPYGDFLTSGSKDTSIKLWDIRRKGCIFTYKGHTEAVNSLKFSPDGQWIASGGNEGIVKLWDLRMGRMLKEFTEHTGPINAVEFHPHEFLLASTSQDHTINFWDLEHFNLVSTTGRESSPSRCLLFSNAGEVLFSGAADMLRGYGWEPARIITTKPIPWGKVRDMAVSLANDKVIAASYHSTNVTVWMIGTSELNSAGCLSPELQEDSPKGIPFSHGNSLRKSFSKQKPSPEAKKALSVKTIEESERSETDPEDETQPEIHNVRDYQSVFQPSRALNRSPTISIYESPRPPATPALYKNVPPSNYTNEPPETELDVIKMDDDDDAPDDRPANRTFTLSESNVFPQKSPGAESPQMAGDIFSSVPGLGMLMPGTASTPKLFDHPANMMANVVMDRRQSLSPPVSLDPSINFPALPPATLPSSPVTSRYQRRLSVTRDPGPSAFAAHPSSGHPDNEFPVKLSSIHHSSSESNVPRAASVNANAQRHSTKYSRSIPHTSTSTLPKPMLRETKSDRGQFSSSPSISPPRTPEDEFIPMTTDRPTGLNFEEFLPRSYHKRMSYPSAMPNMSDSEVITQLTRGHEQIVAILKNRQIQLQVLYNTWQNRDLKTAVETAVNSHDLSVLVDFISIIILRPRVWTLDICVALLPIILELLQSKYEFHMKAGCDALRLIVTHFVPVIKTNVLSGSAGMGVDIPREERYQKSIKCYNTLVSIRAFLLKKQTLQGSLGQAMRELGATLVQLDVKADR